MEIDLGIYGTILAGIILLGVGIAKNSKEMTYLGVALAICSSIIFQLHDSAAMVAKILLLVVATIVFIVAKRKDY